MKTKATLFALTTLLLSSSAFAADINGGSLKDGDIFKPTEGMVNWTGFYVGVQGGYGNANHNMTTEAYTTDSKAKCTATAPATCTDVNGDVVQAGEFGIYENGVAIPLTSIDGWNSDGGIGGGRVGFDLARGRLLFGIYGEYNVSAMEGEAAIFPGLPGGLTFGLEKDDEWSVGGRLGYIVAPRTLAYVLAAYTQTDYNLTGFDGAALAGYNVKDGATFDGVTVGGGVEFALTSNVFFGLEYAHTFYGEETILDVSKKLYTDTPDFKSGRGGLRIIDDLDEDKIMATLKIKLNGFGN
jgi:opacity protein-like surface antigen